jgi:hypothetical protein
MSEIYTRAATIGPASLDIERRTATAVISTGAAVLRGGFRPDGTLGPWREVLSLNGADLARLQGAPVLLDHRANDSSARVGVVRKAWRRNGEILAELQFSERSSVTDLLRDLSQGIGGQVSIGYGVDKWSSK